MIEFTTVIHQFEKMGEKTGWSYIEIPADLAQEMKPGNKKSFRVKGRLDDFLFSGCAVLPMGEGNFILALNAGMRKAIRKNAGALLAVKLEEDKEFKFVPPPELIDCLADEPGALHTFEQLAGSHRNYFIKWIQEAKTEETKTKRIARTVNAMVKHWDYGQMIRAGKGK